MPVQQSQWQDQMLGRYHLKRLLGLGGMGEVWLADDTDLQREIAVKLLPPVLNSQRDYLQAFNREARLVASLEHPHILSIHDFGEFEFGDDIVTYLIMPFISGGSLLDLMNKQQRMMPVEKALHYIRQVAEAIDFAHSKRVLHRDVKPANILLQDDWVFLCDFGIATLLSTQTFRSQAKMSGGTPLYMSPEQCQGSASGASDLYSLAVVTYELLTGITPFEGGGPLEVMLKHIQEEPPSPREFNQRLSQELADALLQALAKDPGQRPSSCLAFVRELERIQASETLIPHIQDDPASTLIKIRSSELNDTLQSASTMVSNTEAKDKISEREATKAEKSQSLISRRSLLLGGVAGVVLLAGGGYALANALYQPPTHRGPQSFMPGVPRLKMTAHSNDVSNVCWSPDSRLLASAGRDTHVMVWDTNAALMNASGKLQVLTHPSVQWKMPGEIFQGDLNWSPDGRFLVTEARADFNARSSEGILSTIDVFTPNSQITNNVDRNSKYKDLHVFLTPAWSPDGKLIAAAASNSLSRDYEGAIIFWNSPGTDSERGIVKVFNSTIKPTDNNYYGLQIVRWSLDGLRILSLDTKYHLLIWDAQTGKQNIFVLPDRSVIIAKRQKLLLDISDSRSLEIIPTRPEQVLVDDVDLAIVYDLTQKKATTLLAVAEPEKEPISLSALAWSSNGRYVAGCHLNSKLIYIWDLANPSPQKTGEGFILPTLSFGKTNGHSDVIIDLAWSPDGRYLASASADFSVIVWQVDAKLEN
ncbi:WD40 repeat domain-containing serine/threonine protein kinase [Ktedonospora formicarum]|uniref:non-specific serine/threonine protein kinase n=1 Tax=Ktedonospora formicarum TaxID=2778364 RepID=A0A8J3MVG3_9CHLR|nr:serine/threonine-protein kinase [Ktedonospora formicarum]GHO46490.1 hypothetical protein KSX_46530 [Ktedonospora formicarum]